MATSGTYAFAPNAGDIVLQAFARIQIRRPALLTEHFADARAELNLMQAAWANRGPSLWTIDQQSVSLVAGTATYSVSASTIGILDAWLSDGTTDTPISPMTREDYAAITTKGTTGTPTQFWFSRTVAPTITVYPVPSAATTLHYFRSRMQQDAEIAGAVQVDVPAMWIDALVAELSYRLARIYKAELEMARKADAAEAFALAMSGDVEKGPLRFAPDLSAYYR